MNVTLEAYREIKGLFRGHTNIRILDTYVALIYASADDGFTFLYSTPDFVFHKLQLSVENLKRLHQSGQLKIEYDE